MKDKSLSEVDWEIDQLTMAIRYYEDAFSNSYSILEAKKYDETIKSLNKRIKELERSRNVSRK